MLFERQSVSTWNSLLTVLSYYNILINLLMWYGNNMSFVGNYIGKHCRQYLGAIHFSKIFGSVLRRNVVS